VGKTKKKREKVTKKEMACTTNDENRGEGKKKTRRIRVGNRTRGVGKGKTKIGK